MSSSSNNNSDDESLSEGSISSSGNDDDDEHLISGSDFVAQAMCREQAHLDWKRRMKLRKNYVHDDNAAYAYAETSVAEALMEDVDIEHPSSKDLVWILEQLCESDVISIESLQHIIDEDIIEMEDVKCSSFFHRACYNKNITRDIINYLLEFYPEAADITTEMYCLHRHPDAKTSSYPLHLACLNDHCSTEIVMNILKRNPIALYHMCMLGREIQTGDYDHTHVEGLPLHYYLSRTCNMDLELVQHFVKRDPECLRTADDDAHIAPIHVLCCNPGVNDMLDVLEFLIATDPESVHFDGGYYRVPFLMACHNKNATLPLVRLLFDYWPEAIHQQDSCGDYAMHLLASNDELSDEASEEIFHFLFQKNFESLGEENHDEYLPIHYAARDKSPEFCKLLIDAYPESIKIGVDGSLPFHEACCAGVRLDTIEFLYELYPESVGIRGDDGYLPIHRAAQNSGGEAAEIIKYILFQDPGSASPVRMYSLHIACGEYGVNLNTVALLFDVFPGAIYERNDREALPIEMAENRRDDKGEDIATYLREQLVHVNKAIETASTRLPLHHVLQQDDVSLGAIKLIVGNFPASVHTSRSDGALPLHIACEHASVDIVKYLIDADDCLDVCDTEGRYPLHYACIGSKHEVIKYLLEKNVSSISERSNTTGMLPFHLLCMSGDGIDENTRECPEYIGSLWRVLTAYPDAILNA